MRLAYADPVHLGCSRLYPEHAESGIWDDPETHRALVGRLVEEFPDGIYRGGHNPRRGSRTHRWAMSLSSPSLRVILPIMTQHWDMAACPCWVCVAGRSAGCRAREPYLNDRRPRVRVDL